MFTFNFYSVNFFKYMWLFKTYSLIIPEFPSNLFIKSIPSGVSSSLYCFLNFIFKDHHFTYCYFTCLFPNIYHRDVKKLQWFLICWGGKHSAPTREQVRTCLCRPTPLHPLYPPLQHGDKSHRVASVGEEANRLQYCKVIF